ncbi:MAG: glycosyltransferase family 4 protein [Thermoanaerobaculia bacterium]|nr:glycosyltransferase family 4 protein [Thermoanaerobaculia bacterium]
MRVFQILEKSRFDTGSVHQMFQAAAGLHDRAHEVTILSRYDSSLEGRARTAGIDFVPLPFASDADLRTIRAIARLVREKRPDVIHVHKGRSHTLALLATWRRPVGAFVVNRGVSFPLTIWNRHKYRTSRVDRIVTVCEQIRGVIVESGRVPREKVEVVYAGTDVELFDPARWDRRDFRAEKAIPADDFVYMQVGIRDWKGWREVVDSFSDVAARGAGVRLVLVAYKSEDDRRAIESHASDRGVGGLVTAVEPRDDMARVLASADCVVDASWGGTGITGTIREAMALAKPVVATDCGGNRELVASPEVGWLVAPRDRAALSSAMFAVLDDRAAAAAAGRAARSRVVEGFSKSIRIDKLERLYRSILEGKGRAG